MSDVVAVSAEDINREHALATRCAESAIEHAIRCGQMLQAKKSELPHGQFMAWVSANCDFKYSTAARYVTAARQSSTGVELSSLSDVFPSGRQAARQSLFLETALMHMDEWAALERGLVARTQKLEDAIRGDDLDVLVDLCRGTSYESDIAVLRIRIMMHLGGAFTDGLTLADAIGAKPEALAAALGVEPDLSLEDWLTQDAA